MTGTSSAKMSSAGARKRPDCATALWTGAGISVPGPIGPSHRRTASMRMLPPNTAATIAARSSNRVQKINCPVGPASVRTPIMSEKSTSAMAALMKAFFRMNAMSDVVDALTWSEEIVVTRCLSDFFDFGAAEQAGRHEDQYHDQDRERGDVLVLDREIGRPEGLDQADRKAPHHRAGQRADAAEHGRGECLDAGDEAHEEVDQAVIEQVHDTCHRGQRRADHEGHRDGAVDV